MADRPDYQNDLSPEQIVRELRATFREESYELLVELESALLELEAAPDDKELVGRVFRALHTIKGSSGACEFGDIVTFTHDVESVFDLIRNGRARATKEIIDQTLAARDQIKAMLDRYYENGTADPEKAQGILQALRALIRDCDSGQPRKELPVKRAPAAPEITYRIRFSLQEEPGAKDAAIRYVLQQLQTFGPCTVRSHLDESQPDRPASWDVIVTTNKGQTAIQDAFLLIRNISELTVEEIDTEAQTDACASYKKIGEILVDRGDVSAAELDKALTKKKKVGELLIENGAVGHAQVESALVEQQHVREVREQRQSSQETSNIRVATAKLDSLVDLVGELVSVQARLSQLAAARDDTDLLSIAEEVERLTGMLRDNTMNIRMLPIGTTFGKFKRLVHDLSADLGKEIELTTDGAETELDKTVIDRLGDPLVHIIRNSIDHGIESPAAREAAGKPRQGTIRLAAMHSGAHVVIRVEDDGAGLDTDAIRDKAIALGLLRPEQSMNQNELQDLVLAPGFSTAKSVTDVSGRGVGMDVVKRSIDALRGTISIESRKGKGTAVVLQLPLTLAIIDGFLTRIGAEHFIFPLTLVEECVELERKDCENGNGRRLAHVRGEIVPYIRLRELFNLGGETPAIEQIVITGVDNRRTGIVVDMIVGQHQTVLKSLGQYYQSADGISGATILGDGSVALVLDIPTIVRLVEQQEARLAGMQP